jgi:hypothetical protein
MSRNESPPKENRSPGKEERLKGGEVTRESSHELGNAQAESMRDYPSSGSNELVLYDQMRLSVDRCAAIDEAAGIKDKAQKLEYYAKIRDDRPTETRFAEIKMRAIIKIGELSRDLEKADPGPEPKDTSHRREVSKTKALKEAGISKSAANRYEQLAGPREKQAQAAVGAAIELAYAKARETDTPITTKQINSAVKKAVSETLGEPVKPKKSQRELSPVDDAVLTRIANHLGLEARQTFEKGEINLKPAELKEFSHQPKKIMEQIYPLLAEGAIYKEALKEIGGKLIVLSSTLNDLAGEWNEWCEGNQNYVLSLDVGGQKAGDTPDWTVTFQRYRAKGAKTL